MTWFQTLRIALRALLRNKLRSFLTMLGIIIGVSAVIAMVAIGEGAKARVEEQFAAMGTNLLILLPGATTSGGVSGGFGSSSSLTWDDLRAIQSELPSVRAAAPALRRNMQLLSEEQNWSTSVNGTTPAYFSIRSWPMERGVAISQSDVDSAAKVAVLGQTAAAKLFGTSADPVGQIVRMGNTPYTVIGVAARKGQSSTGQDYDDVAFMPVTTFMTKVQGGLQKYLNGTVFIGANGDVARTERDVVSLLRDRHNLGAGADDDFSIRNLSEIAGAQQEGTKTLTTLLASVAAVSLLVGGIGIMNIMLVSVTERTREIGVRMAMGAKPRHILAQFLVEALALSLLGGLIGVGLGVGGAGALANKFGWPMLIRTDITLIAVVFSAVVGVVFGLYPARKASRLDPIQALRFELVAPGGPSSGPLSRRRGPKTWAKGAARRARVGAAAAARRPRTLAIRPRTWRFGAKTPGTRDASCSPRQEETTMNTPLRARSTMAAFALLAALATLPTACTEEESWHGALSVNAPEAQGGTTGAARRETRPVAIAPTEAAAPAWCDLDPSARRDPLRPAATSTVQKEPERLALLPANEPCVAGTCTVACW